MPSFSVEVALLDHHHRVSLGGQFLGYYRAAGAGADYDNLRLDGFVPGAIR